MSVLKSWIPVNTDNDFPIQNIPFGIIKKKDGQIVAATRIGDTVINLNALFILGYFTNDKLPYNVFANESLNEFIALGRPFWKKVRNTIIDLFQADSTELQTNDEHKNIVLTDLHKVEVLLPVEIGDYTDFYSSIDHATNVGTMFRDPANALLSNWKHLPVGYHGRSSSIVVSGTNIHRPNGQTKPANSDVPVFGPSKLLDFELEMAFITGKETALGDTISTQDAEDAIFGAVIFNDLSARDIQTWEYVPLGPFLSKSFGSVISPWIITLDALEHFKVKGPIQDPEVFPYLRYKGDKNYDINLEVYIQPENTAPTQVCTSNYKYLYWNMSQQLAHQTINGCNIKVGDLYASGTISGPKPNEFGSMLELTWRGTKPLKLDNGEERKFINDNDTISMKAYGIKDGIRIGFGESRTMILPAKSLTFTE